MYTDQGVSEVQFCTTKCPQFCEFEAESFRTCSLRFDTSQLTYPTFNLQINQIFIIHFFLFQFGSVCKNEYLTVCSCTTTCLFSNPRLNWNNYTISNMRRASSIISFTIFVGQPSQLFKRSFQLGSYFCSQMDCELQVGYSSNKIRKTQNEHLYIVCQNLNCL